jgi:hypothetical protein
MEGNNEGLGSGARLRLGFAPASRACMSEPGFRDLGIAWMIVAGDDYAVGFVWLRTRALQVSEL